MSFNGNIGASFRDLAALKPGPNGLDPKEVGEVMARYATEVVRPDA